MTTRLHVNQKSNRTGVALVATLLLVSAAGAGAQETQLASADAHWAPWVGCWQASARDAATQAANPSNPVPTVCIVPTAEKGVVDLVTLNGVNAPTSERVDGNGARRTVSREGCTGWETADFSPGGDRLYLKSEYQCTGNRTRTSSGLMSLTPNGEWLDVQGVKVDANSAVRVVHYGRVPTPGTLSPEMKQAIDGQKLATNTAVMGATDSVRIADVVEATKRVDPLVVQTWLVQLGQGFNMDVKKLDQLADAKVAPSVIDVMVALSYPRAFAINLAQLGGEVVQTEQTRDVAANDRYTNGPTVFMSWDPMYSSSYGYNNSYFFRGSQYYNGYYPPGYWYGNTPVVITRPSDNVNVPAPDTRGRMVKGKGYTRPADGGQPRSSTSDGSSSSTRGSSGGGTSGGGSSGGGSSSGTERTAKPRSP